jgi:hypothetical protein
LASTGRMPILKGLEKESRRGTRDIIYSVRSALSELSKSLGSSALEGSRSVVQGEWKRWARRAESGACVLTSSYCHGECHLLNKRFTALGMYSAAKAMRIQPG